MAKNEYPNSGILFENKRKQNDRAPDYVGDGTVDGKPYKLAAWKKQGQKGPFLSVNFTPKDAADANRAAPREDRGEPF